MTRYALCIGINDYPGTSSDLSVCVPDARDFAAALDARGFAVRQLLTAPPPRRYSSTSWPGWWTAPLRRHRDRHILRARHLGADTDGDEATDGTRRCVRMTCSPPARSPTTTARIFTLPQFGARLVLISDSCHSAR
jgi:hypothetical protein